MACEPVRCYAPAPAPGSLPVIVAAVDGGWRCVTQPDHARLSAELLALWRDDPLPDHPHRERLLAATREHDNGWQEEDAAPRRAPGGDRPLGFVEMPPSARREIWRRGIDRWSERDPYVAALIAQHAAHLTAPQGDAADVETYLRRRDELLEACGVAEAELVADYRWLHLADLASLAVCADWRAPAERWEFEVSWSGTRLSIAPFPFAGATTFAVPARVIPHREYDSDADLATELALARWDALRFQVAPAESPPEGPEIA